MIIAEELQEQIRRALRGEVSLDELYAWLMARSWNMHKDSSPEAVELAANVEALFFDRSSSNLDDAAVRSHLTTLAGNPRNLFQINVTITVARVAQATFPVTSTARLIPLPEIRIALPA